MAAVIKGDEIHLFADAAFYDYETGILTAIHPKIWQIPHINGAFVSRGCGCAFLILQELLSLEEWSSWDELKASLPLVWACFDKLMGDDEGDVMLAGFSDEHSRPEILYRTTGEAYENFQPGHTYIYTEGFTSFGCNMERGDNPSQQAIEAFEKARNEKYDISFGRAQKPVMAHAIGGRLQRAVLTRTGSTAATLLKWPDEVGKLIRPNLAA